MVVDALVRAALQEVCGTQEAQHGFRWAAGEHNICFYADDGRISGRYPIWVQTALTTMVRMFERVVMQTNLGNTKAIICTPGVIWGKQGVEAYTRRATGEGPTFCKRKRTRVSCNECGGAMAVSSLQHHMVMSRVRLLPQVRGVDSGG